MTCTYDPMQSFTQSNKLQVVKPIGKLVNEWVRGGLLGKSVDARVVSGDQVEKMRDNLPKTRAKGEDEMQATMKTQQHKENKLAGTQCTLPACVCLTLQRGGHVRWWPPAAPTAVLRTSRCECKRWSALRCYQG